MIWPIWRLWRRANDDLEQNKIVCAICGVDVEHFVTIDVVEWEVRRGLLRSSISRSRTDEVSVMDLCVSCFSKLPEDIDEIIVEFVTELITTPKNELAVWSEANLPGE